MEDMSYKKKGMRYASLVMALCLTASIGLSGCGEKRGDEG